MSMIIHCFSNDSLIHSPSMKIACYDVGSNTIRCLIGIKEPSYFHIEQIWRKITRLAGGFADGYLAEDSINRSLSVLVEFAELANLQGVEEHRMALTGVMRKAKNAGKFLEDIRRKTNITPYIISGSAEGQLSFKGARWALTISESEISALADIGGFSTEFTIGNHGESESISCNIGVVRMTEDLASSDPISREDLESMQNAATQYLEPIHGLMLKISTSTLPKLIANAGTATTLAAMDLRLKTYSPSLVNGYNIKKDRVENLLQKLAATPKNQRLDAFPGLEQGREDLMPAGMILALEIMKQMGSDELMVSIGGILHGLLMSDNWPVKNY